MFILPIFAGVMAMSRAHGDNHAYDWNYDNYRYLLLLRVVSKRSGVYCWIRGIFDYMAQPQSAL